MGGGGGGGEWFGVGEGEKIVICTMENDNAGCQIKYSRFCNQYQKTFILFTEDKSCVWEDVCSNIVMCELLLKLKKTHMKELNLKNA